MILTFLVGIFGMQLNILIITITHILNRPFFMSCNNWTINWSVKLAHGLLA